LLCFVITGCFAGLGVTLPVSGAPDISIIQAKVRAQALAISAALAQKTAQAAAAAVTASNSASSGAGAGAAGQVDQNKLKSLVEQIPTER
jgi:hypothetical protein